MLAGGTAPNADPAGDRPRPAFTRRLFPAHPTATRASRQPALNGHRSSPVATARELLLIANRSASIRFRTENLMRCTRSLCAISGCEQLQYDALADRSSR